jgi:shikimate kinase
MGTGKSVVGKQLAAELKMDFLDTDALIEQTVKRSIDQIFAEQSEEKFRELETRALKTLQGYDNFVLSTGGGIILRSENVKMLHQLGPVIWLQAAPEAIWERIKDESHRPLLKVPEPLAEIKRLLNERWPFYEAAADWQLETEGRAPAELADKIIQWLKSRST